MCDEMSRPFPYRRPTPAASSPMTALGSVPKAHTQGEPDGTWNLEKLHLELKYLGRKLADAKLQRRKAKLRLVLRVTAKRLTSFEMFHILSHDKRTNPDVLFFFLLCFM